LRQELAKRFREFLQGRNDFLERIWCGGERTLCSYELIRQHCLALHQPTAEGGTHCQMDAALPPDTSALGNLVAIVLRISRSNGVWIRRPLFRSGAETSSHGISPDTNSSSL